MMNLNLPHPSLIKHGLVEIYKAFLRQFILLSLHITGALCFLWYHQEEQLLQTLIHDDQNREFIKERIKSVWQTLCISSGLIALKGFHGIFIMNDRKGSACLQFNHYCNVAIALFTGFSLIISSHAIYCEGIIGLVARTILIFLTMAYLALLRTMQKCCVFVDTLLFSDFIWVGDVLEYPNIITRREVAINGRFEVIDTHLSGIGGVICRDENSGEIVDIPSTLAIEGNSVWMNR
ncbi:hypothetical protein COLO4_19212 [Corchorus olitorius]|uniref:Uncharacterized protein n=1 Tax=Corchorus olitorius TaxID=93759 RepID=A0A1R3J688_9ROSI|nr:hypothetical protein COLO4_19212 [Corchorus olitorius]